MVAFNLYTCCSRSFIFYEASRNYVVRHEDARMVV